MYCSCNELQYQYFIFKVSFPIFMTLISSLTVTQLCISSQKLYPQPIICMAMSITINFEYKDDYRGVKIPIIITKYTMSKIYAF